MDDLIAFLRARLKEDETVARAADGDGVFDGTGIVVQNHHEPRLRRTAALRSTVAIHIARHDPAAVLRRCAADRKMVELHAAEPGQHPDFCWHDKHELPCPTLRLLAEGYGLTE